MGAKESLLRRRIFVLDKKTLTDSDYEFLISHTGLTKKEIKEIYEQFKKDNSDLRLNKIEFINLYDKLKPDPNEIVSQIAEQAFRAFDYDKNGSITFSEFLIAYALTSRGDLKKKLDFAFSIYDSNLDGVVTRDEIREIIIGMTDVLGAYNNNDEETIVDDCIKDLDFNLDTKIDKDEFIKGLMSNFRLRGLMNPFN